MKRVTQLNELEVTYGVSRKILSSPKIIKSNDAFDLLFPSYNPNTIGCQEQFNILYLNKANKPIGVYKSTTGGVNSTIADMRLILGMALKTLASGIIISHNHPSGSLFPSEDDLKLTKKIQQACLLLDIVLLDHLIISPLGEFYSFAENGNL